MIERALFLTSYVYLFQMFTSVIPKRFMHGEVFDIYDLRGGAQLAGSTRKARIELCGGCEGGDEKNLDEKCTSRNLELFWLDLSTRKSLLFV